MCVLVALCCGATGCNLDITPTPTSQQPELTATTLTLATWGSQEEMTLLHEQLADFEAQHPDTHVVVRHIPENYLQKLHLLAAGNLLPDVVMINSWHLPMFAQHGVFLPLNQSISENNFYPQALESLTIKGDLLAVPRDLSNLVMVVNTDLFKDAGLPLPKRDRNSTWTWEDLEDIGQQWCAFNQAHSDKKPIFTLAINRQPALFWLPWAWANDGELFTTKGSLDMSSFEARQGLAGLAKYMAYAHPRAENDQCQLAPGPKQLGQATPTQWFLQQRLAIVLTGRWSVPLFRKAANFTWDVWPLPSANDKTPSITGIDATGYAVSAQSKNPEAAKALIRFLTSETSLAGLARGGLVIPARPAEANSEAFLSHNKLPQHDKVFLDVITNGHPTPHIADWGALEDDLRRALDPLWDKPGVTVAELQRALRDVSSEASNE